MVRRIDIWNHVWFFDSLIRVNQLNKFKFLLCSGFPHLLLTKSNLQSATTAINPQQIMPRGREKRCSQWRWRWKPFIFSVINLICSASFSFRLFEFSAWRSLNWRGRFSTGDDRFLRQWTVFWEERHHVEHGTANMFEEYQKGVGHC